MRYLCTIALAVVLGVIASFGVAFMLMLRSPSSGEPVRRFAVTQAPPSQTFIGEWLGSGGVEVCTLEAIPQLDVALVSPWLAGKQVTSLPWWARERASRLACAGDRDIGVAIGWPLPVATAWFSFPDPPVFGPLTWGTRVSFGSVRRAPLDAPSATQFGSSTDLPFALRNLMQPRVCVVGLVANVSVYSVALFPVANAVVRASLAMRRRRAHRRGVCFNCYYPSGPSNTCSECGQPQCR
jgi:hypothetical protein